MASLVDQFVDTQPPPLSGNNCKDKEFPGCTFPFMETEPFSSGLETQVMDFEDETQVLFEDGLETQVMNFEAETQVLFEDGLETQVMNFVDETQLLDDFDDFENMDTQLLDEWNNEETYKTDGEESDKTDKLCDTDENSENDSVKLVVYSSPNRENTTISKNDKKANEAELDALFYKQTSSGVKLDFTSIHVAAIQASGLAARSKALSKNASGICSSKSDDESLEENHIPCSPTSIRTPLIHSSEIDESVLEAEKVKETKKGSKGMIGKSAVRRLSMDDVNLVEKEGLNSNYPYEVKDGELPQCDELAELSYVDSQGPGDLSQANALDFVDKFIKLSDADIAKAFDIAGSTTKKSKLVSGIKGIQTLARKNGLKSISDKKGIYDWDDNCEDEGGGEFFSRKKKVFFDEVNSLALKMHSSKRTAKKAKVNLLKEVDEELNVDFLKGTKASCLEKDYQCLLNVKTNTEHTHKGASIGEKENKKLPHKYSLRKRCGSFNYEDLTRTPKKQNISATNLNIELTVTSFKANLVKGSPSKLNNSKRTAKKATVEEAKKNLLEELDEELNVDSLNGMQAFCTEKDSEDMLNVGSDTQMAAKAMEVTCLGSNLTNHESKDMNGNKKNTRTCSSIGRKVDKRVCKEYSLRKRSGSFSSEDLTRKSKQQKVSDINLNGETTVASLKQSKRDRKQHKDVDASNFVSPRSGREKVGNCAPSASRPRKLSMRNQSVGDKVTCHTIIAGSSDDGCEPASQHRNEKACEISKRSKGNPQSFFSDQGVKRLTRSSLRVTTTFPSLDKECETDLFNRSGDKEELEEDNLKTKLGENSNFGVSPGERIKSSGIAASPICMGDEYLNQACKKNLLKSFNVRIAGSSSHKSELTSAMKELKRRRDMSDVRVVFSHHLDDDMIKDQKKILAKLGASIAPCIREATHFVTDKFVRTRNMLEAIAFGKPVVTHLWLESCGQAGCCIDENNYILRDANKEKEFGFSLPASLARACQHPLLQGLKVWITPSTKPGVEILSSLVKAVLGLPVERIGRSVLKDDKVPDDLIVLSCKEDYAACLPFIEKGGAVFSSELLLNGIVTQKLEYERYRLFEDHIKKTRSTIWLKQDSNQYLRVAKCK